MLGCCLDHSDIVGSALVYIVNHEFYAEPCLQASQQIEHVQTRNTYRCIVDITEVYLECR